MRSSRSTPLVGQAVVTDPLEKGGGYVLVAASNGVRPEERQYLEDFPAAGDALHLERVPGKYYSFLRLPGGRWGLTKRFASGKRRVSFHRIVAHTLVLSEQVLELFAFEPWLLVSSRCWRRHGEREPLSFGDLEAEAEDRQLKNLLDLEPIPPADPVADRREAWKRWRKVWEGKPLANELGRVFCALASERGVLWPYGRETDALLHLAWSALPLSERLSRGWTTHLTPAVRGFHLALAPENVIASERLTGPWRWVEEDAGTISDGTRCQLEGLAAWLARPHDDPLASLEEGYSRYGVRAIGSEGGTILSWLSGVDRDCGALEEISDPAPLEAFLEGAEATGPIPEDIKDDTRLLGAIWRSAGGGIQRKAEVDRILRAHGLHQVLTRPSVVVRLLKDPSAQARDLLAGAQLSRSNSTPEGRAATIAILKGVGDRVRAEPSVLSPEEKVDLARQSSEISPEAIDAQADLLLQEPNFNAVVNQVEVGNRPDRLALALFRRALPNNGEYAAMVVERVLLPWLLNAEPSEQLDRSRGGSTVLAKDVAGEILQPALWRTSIGFRRIFEKWPVKFAESALAALHVWVQEAREDVAEVLVPEVAGRLAQSCHQILGLSYRLVGVLHRDEAWVPFALAELEALMSPQGKVGVSEVDHFADAVKYRGERFRLPPKLLEALFDDLGASSRAGGVRRRLIEKLAPELAQANAPAVLLAGIRNLERHSLESLLAWAPALAALTRELRQMRKDPLGAQVASSWLIALDRRLGDGGVPETSAAMIELVEALAGTSWVNHVLDTWRPRFEGLAAAQSALLDAFESIAPPRDREAIGRMRQRERVRGGDRVGVVAGLGPGDWRRKRPDLADVLPPQTQPAARLRAIGELLASPQVLPSIKRLLEQVYLDPAIQILGPKIVSFEVPDGAWTESLFVSRIANQVGSYCNSDQAAVIRFAAVLAHRHLHAEIGALVAGAGSDAPSLLGSLKRHLPAYDQLAQKPMLSYLHLVSH